MELTGRPQGYRGVAIRCPGCAEAMSIEKVDGADVDVCAACGGLWVDWFDGEVRAIAEGVVKGGVTGRAIDPGAVRNEARALGACPRCARHLVSERYETRTQHARPTLGGSVGHAVEIRSTGAELLRCEDCAGAFVSRTSLEVLAALPPAIEDPPRSEPPSRAPPMPWGRLGALVRAVFGRGEP